jgi:hypothetical protein
VLCEFGASEQQCQQHACAGCQNPPLPLWSSTRMSQLIECLPHSCINSDVVRCLTRSYVRSILGAIGSGQAGTDELHAYGCEFCAPSTHTFKMLGSDAMFHGHKSPQLLSQTLQGAANR